ncbi:MAG TPA: VTT domain-containing protein [Burkholderiales bacterium]|nr:VTT domain-containing protein [Burkholderiales bacterium]
MLLSLVYGGIRRIVERNARRVYYAPLVGVIAFGATLSMSVPCVPILTLAVLLNAPQWRRIVLCAALGSGCGALLLLLAFHHLGWTELIARFPEILTSRTWGQITAWLERYQLPALFVVAASPLPQTPSLIFAAIAEVPPVEVFVVLVTGKLLKYGVVAWCAVRFPQWFTNASIGKVGG